MGIFDIFKKKDSKSSGSKKKMEEVSLSDYLKFDPVKKAVYLLKLWQYKYPDVSNLIDPSSLKLCSDEESMKLLLKYSGDLLPAEVKQDAIKIESKETASYFYGLYLYKELTGKFYEIELNDKNILKPGIYQFLRKTLDPDPKKRTQYPSDLIFLLELYDKEELEEKQFFAENGIEMEVFSTVGLFRKENQDSCGYVVKDRDNSIFIVADGMGGGADGKKASLMAVNIIKENYRKLDPGSSGQDEKIQKFIKSSFMQVNSSILNYAEVNKLKDMGTTLSVALICNGMLFTGHSGDSRIYLVRDGRTYLLSLDQSNVEVLIREGKIAEDQRENYEKNVLAYYMGNEKLQEKDICTISDNENLLPLIGQNGKKNSLHLKDNDIFFICSDGVWDCIEEKNDSEELSLEFISLKQLIYSRIPTDNFTFVRGRIKN